MKAAQEFFGDAAEDVREVGRDCRLLPTAALPGTAGKVMAALVDDWHDELKRLYEETCGMGQAIVDSAKGYLLADLSSKEDVVRLGQALDFDAGR